MVNVDDLIQLLIPRPSKLAGIVRARVRFLASSYKDFVGPGELVPEPETPVTRSLMPSGRKHRYFLSCFCCPAHCDPAVGCRRLHISRKRDLDGRLKYAPVIDFSFFMISSAVQPPRLLHHVTPAPGPISQSVLCPMVSSSCSTTSTVFPRARDVSGSQEACRCRADAGRTRLVQTVGNSVQTGSNLRCQDGYYRCASPRIVPVAGRETDTPDRHSARKSRRALISFKIDDR